jgi:hypothetical protein
MRQRSLGSFIHFLTGEKWTLGRSGSFEHQAFRRAKTLEDDGTYSPEMFK